MVDLPPPFALKFKNDSTETASKDTDCSTFVDSTPSCANSSWIMYARPAGAASPYFCCEPDQIALVPNQCVGSDFQLAGTPLATTVCLEDLLMEIGAKLLGGPNWSCANLLSCICQLSGYKYCYGNASVRFHWLITGAKWSDWISVYSDRNNKVVQLLFEWESGNEDRPGCWNPTWRSGCYLVGLYLLERMCKDTKTWSNDAKPGKITRGKC
jgi:hypothetical protein